MIRMKLWNFPNLLWHCAIKFQELNFFQDDPKEGGWDSKWSQAMAICHCNYVSFVGIPCEQSGGDESKSLHIRELLVSN